MSYHLSAGLSHGSSEESSSTASENVDVTDVSRHDVGEYTAGGVTLLLHSTGRREEI